MPGMLTVALLSVGVSLSLCVVPALARLTVFPLLLALVHKFAAAYATDSVRIEFCFGSCALRKHRSADSELARGVTISLFFVTVQSEFLKSLAFAKQGLAPDELQRVAIEKIEIHVTTTWKMVVKLEGVSVDGRIVDPNVDGVFELQDAVAMKLTEAANWITLLDVEHRVLQQIAAQVDIHVSKLRVTVTELTPGAAAVDGHDEVNEEKDGMDADEARNGSIFGLLLKPTRVSFALNSCDVLSDVLHENVDEALQLILTSEEIKVEHAMSMKGGSICATVVDGEDGSEETVVEKKVDLLKGKREKSPGEKPLLSFSSLAVKLHVPPMPRVLGIVEDIAPISMMNRGAQVELLSSSTINISITRELVVGVLRDLVVPYNDHQVLVQSVRTLEHDESVRKPMFEEGEIFYVSYFNKEDSNKSLSSQQKAEINEKLRTLEIAMSLNNILKLRSRATGLAKCYRRDQDELTLADVKAIVLENATKTSNIMFRVLQIALRSDSIVIGFVERGHQVSEMAVVGFGANVHTYAIAEGEEKQKLDVDVVVGQTTFLVNVESSAPKTVAPTEKLLFADFGNVATDLNNVKVILAVGALVRFLLYVDRLSTKSAQVLSTARPPPTPATYSEQLPVSVDIAESEMETMTKEVPMSSFSLFGELLLKLDVSMSDCRILLLPTPSYSKSLYTDMDVETWQNDYEVDCHGDIPVTFSICLESSKVKESMEFNAQSFSIGAQYVHNAEEMETILAPTNVTLHYALEQDSVDSLTCHQSIMVHMPDVLVSGSDLSLSLLASCVEALGELLLLLRRVKIGDTLLESELGYLGCALFKEIDQDGDGFLEFQELRAYLRDDLLSDNSVAASGAPSGDGSNALSGFLNLRGSEYNSSEAINKMSETKIACSEQLAEWIQRPVFVERFWELFESEAHLTKRSLCDQDPLDVQKKLVRLLNNYDAANLMWDALVLPVLEDLCTDHAFCEWLLQPFTHCGGLIEYQSAAKVIAKKKRGIFSAAMNEAEHLISKLTQSANPVKKELRLTTDVRMGNLRLVLTDTELPTRFCRGDFVIKDVKLSVRLTGKEIDENGPVDWVGLATSGDSDWMGLFGFKLSSSCYSEAAADMEFIIEQRELVVGLSSSDGENGFSVTMEATK
ncbi:unnamed protein product [Hyaloperonospora brassicae]|uniref:EF-hand domain-containing protein n=1 Tax=Hyaloperonospora brassicae TaxID=162125 RepID=A0AAV0TLR1_HYABA|nr:unnamed protein product [Hyaloperonospora brassicae]